MSRILYLLFCILFIVGTVAGCSHTKLNKAFNHKKVTAAAREVVTLLNDREFDTLIDDMIREDLQDNFRNTDLDGSVDFTYGNAGDFKKFASVKIYGQKDPETDEDCAVAIIMAQYENQNVEFTLTFDTDMKLTGLYMK